MNLLNCLGIGTVTMNKQTDTGEIFVNIGNKFPSQDGEIIADVEDTKSEHTSTTGNTEVSTGIESNGEPATWMRLNSNRLTSPDVRVGTKVVVYEWMNSNKKLWTTFGLDMTMRLETVVWVFSASPNIDENSPITPDNFYIFTISSHKKKIEMLTGQGNGEAIGLQLTFNLGDGWLGWMDTLGGIFVHNGVERSLTYTNSDATKLSVDKKDFSLINKGNTLIQTEQSITMKSKAIALIADDTLDLRTRAFTLNTSSAHLTASSGFDFFGDIRQNGAISATGAIKSDADVLAASISLRGHVHPGVQSGGSRTAVAV